MYATYLPKGLAGCHMKIFHSWAIAYPESNKFKSDTAALAPRLLAFYS